MELMTVEGAVALANAGMSGVGIKVLYDLLGPSLKVSSEMLADQFYLWKWRNRVRIAEKFKAICDEKNLSPKVVPPDFLLPALDAAGNVEDDDLQHLWAQLLVSGMEHDNMRHPRFAHILSAMSPQDAHLFEWICNYYEDERRFWNPFSGPRLNSQDAPPCVTWEATRFSFFALCGLNIVSDAGGYTTIYDDLDRIPIDKRDNDTFFVAALTWVGVHFAKAVRGRAIRIERPEPDPVLDELDH